MKTARQWAEQLYITLSGATFSEGTAKETELYIIENAIQSAIDEARAEAIHEAASYAFNYVRDCRLDGTWHVYRDNPDHLAEDLRDTIETRYGMEPCTPGAEGEVK